MTVFGSMKVIAVGRQDGNGIFGDAVETQKAWVAEKESKRQGQVEVPC